MGRFWVSTEASGGRDMFELLTECLEALEHEGGVMTRKRRKTKGRGRAEL